MKNATDKFDDEYMPHGPRSVFYRGRNHSKSQRLHSFRKTHETQQKLDNQRHRKEQRSK